MRREALGLTLTLWAGAAHAELPTIAWDDANPGYFAHQAPPLERTLLWSCDDPSDEWPLTQRCQVYDLTAGTLGSGTDVLLSDVDCGTAESDPSAVTHTYDVSGPVDGHRYAYVAACTDSEGRRYRSSRSGFYDSTGPTVTLLERPVRRSRSNDPDFAFSCSDASYGWDFSYLSTPYVPDCDLRCTLRRGDGSVYAGEQPCDVFTVNQASPNGTQDYADVPVGTYLFSVYGRDGAGNVGPTVSWQFTVVDPSDDTALDGTETDLVPTDDNPDTDTDSVDTDDSDPSSGETDTDDGPKPITGDCGCAQAPTPHGLVLGFGLVLVAASRRQPLRRTRGSASISEVEA